MGLNPDGQLKHSVLVIMAPGLEHNIWKHLKFFGNSTRLFFFFFKCFCHSILAGFVFLAQPCILPPVSENNVSLSKTQEFDKKYNPTWHCIVGRNFGSYVTHETKHFIYFYLGQVAILLFKSGWGDALFPLHTSWPYIQYWLNWQRHLSFLGKRPLPFLCCFLLVLFIRFKTSVAMLKR